MQDELEESGEFRLQEKPETSSEQMIGQHSEQTGTEDGDGGGRRWRTKAEDEDGGPPAAADLREGGEPATIPFHVVPLNMDVKRHNGGKSRL